MSNVPDPSSDSAPIPTPTPLHKISQGWRRVSLSARVRNWFLTGVILTGPIALTIYVTAGFVNTIDGWAKSIIPSRFWPEAFLPFNVPGFGVVLAFVSLTLLGFLTANFVGRRLIRLGELLLNKMPIIRTLYKALKQVFETVFSPGGTSFRRVCLVEFPRPGQWSLGFISADPSAPLRAVLPEAEAYVSVFVPCAPNPSSGFYFYIAADKVREVSVTPDEGFQTIMSAGLIQPEGRGGESRETEKKSGESL